MLVEIAIALGGVGLTWVLNTANQYLKELLYKNVKERINKHAMEAAQFAEEKGGNKLKVATQRLLELEPHLDPEEAVKVIEGHLYVLGLGTGAKKK